MCAWHESIMASSLLWINYLASLSLVILTQPLWSKFGKKAYHRQSRMCQVAISTLTDKSVAKQTMPQSVFVYPQSNAQI